MEVHTELGFEFSEIVYMDALKYEFKKNGIPFTREVRYQVKYKEAILPYQFCADFVVFDTIILEVKTVSDLCNDVLNRLLITQPFQEWK